MRSPRESVFDKEPRTEYRHYDIKHEDVGQAVETEMGTSGRKNIRQAWKPREEII